MSSETDIAALLGLVSQHARLIEIATAPDLGLVVERFSGREGVSESFRFEIQVLSPSAFLDLTSVLGQPAALRLRRANGGHRAWHGHITEFAALGADGGLARYRLVLSPFTAFLRLRRNALIFQDRDVRGICEQVFAHYPMAAYRFEVSQPLRKRPICTQYRETDFDFVTRLLAEEGLAYRFEHRQDDQDASGAARESGNHVLVVFDRQAETPTATPDTLRFHRIDSTETEDAITVFTEQRQVTPTAVTVASWQPEQVQAPAGQAQAPDGALPLEVYHADRVGVFPQGTSAHDTAELRLDALRLPARLHAGAGSGRGLAPGFAFTLTAHPDLGGAAFVPLAVEWTAANNLGSDAVRLLETPEIEHGSCRNRFVCVPAGTPIVPQFVARPTAPGPQTARVVGLPDSRVTSQRDHQVRVQLWWQRGAAPNPGGLTDTGSSADPVGHAPGNETSGFWVPVAEWIAGPNFGANFLPRIGSEVLLDFEHGDLDQPRVIGQLYHGEDLPPYTAGVDSDANHPGVLSGFRTQGLDGQGGQRWVIDDAPGQLRHQLDSTSADSRLALGRLIEQPGASRGALRGEGFELATQGWGMLRAGEGLLVSTTARAGATSTQLDVAESVGQLKAAEQTAQRLSDAARQAQAVALAANAQQTKFRETIDPEQQGSYTSAVNGQDAKKPKPGGREPGDAVERFGAPVVLLEAPSTILAATPASALAFAGGAQHWTVQQDAQLSAGATFAAVGGRAVSVFAHGGPWQAIAAHGPVSVQAHTDRLELLADRTVTVTSTAESIEVLAQTEIVLQAGQTRVRLHGGDITFECPGNFTVKASQHPFLGGESNAAQLVPLPSGQTKPEEVAHWIGLNYLDPETDEPIADAEYEIHFKGGPKLTGKLDQAGKAHHDGVPDKPVEKVIYKPRPPDADKPPPILEELLVQDDAQGSDE